MLGVERTSIMCDVLCKSVSLQPLFTPLFGTQIFGQYSDKAWNCFTGIFLTLAIASCQSSFPVVAHKTTDSACMEDA